MSELTAFLQNIQTHYPEIQPKAMRLSNDGQFSHVLILRFFKYKERANAYYEDGMMAGKCDTA
jgi:hypothetical protein